MCQIEKIFILFLNLAYVYIYLWHTKNNRVLIIEGRLMSGRYLPTLNVV